MIKTIFCKYVHLIALLIFKKLIQVILFIKDLLMKTNYNPEMAINMYFERSAGTLNNIVRFIVVYLTDL